MGPSAAPVWTGARFVQEAPRVVAAQPNGKPKRPKGGNKNAKNPAAPYPGTLKLVSQRQGETEAAVIYPLSEQAAIAGGPVHATFQGRDLHTVHTGGNRSVINDAQRGTLRSALARELTQDQASSLIPLGLAVQAGTKVVPSWRYTPEGYAAMLAQRWADTELG